MWFVFVYIFRIMVGWFNDNRLVYKIGSVKLRENLVIDNVIVYSDWK